MNFYNLNTEFTFGKHKGKTLRELLKHHRSYINWCSINVNYFYISKEVLDEAKQINPTFLLTKEALEKLEMKLTKWQRTMRREHSEENDICFERESTYENYNGSYAQDEEGWSDQDIDDVFDGEPLMYWNID